MSNEAFQLLSRGGVSVSKSRCETDLFRFNQTNATKNQNAVSMAAAGELPAELNFFKHAQNITGKRKRTDHADDNYARTAWRKEEDSEQEELQNEQDLSNPIPTTHRVKTKGINIPLDITSFAELRKYSIPAHLYPNLASGGYKSPTGVQSHCIPILLEGRDLVAISPTGTGKTLAYLLPIFAKLVAPVASTGTKSGTGVRALVIVPTRELAHQIHNECLRLAQGRKWSVVLFSKATANALSMKAARDKVDIIISTPLRLVVAMQEGNLELSNLRLLVLDEADRLLDNEFSGQVQEIVAASSHSKCQKAFFSATLPANAESMAMGMLEEPIRVVVGLKDTPLPLIEQSLTYVADEPSKLPSLLTFFAQPYNPPVLIFTSTQARATSLADELVLNGILRVDHLHAGMTQKEREDSISRMRKGETWVMVTTEVMARGIDFKGIREVINYDFPTTIQSYIHRIGRTGRAGREGKAVTMFTDDDAPYLKMIANVILQSGSTVPDWMLKLPKPSKMKRKQMGKVKRPDTVNAAREVFRRDAVKKRDMILGSKRRASKAAQIQKHLDSE